MTSARPALTAWLGDACLARVACPRAIAPRDWLLGVVAVQCEAGAARLRANLTGWDDAVVAPLASGQVVHVTFGEVLSRPALAAPDLLGLTVFLDGHELGQAPFAPGRAFGHVFCRYHAGGAEEAGFDLTPFLDLPEGQKYHRLLSRPLSPGQVVSYAWRATG